MDLSVRTEGKIRAAAFLPSPLLITSVADLLFWAGVLVPEAALLGKAGNAADVDDSGDGIATDIAAD